MLALRNHKLDAWFDGEGLRAADPRIQPTNIACELTSKSTYTTASGRDGRTRRKVKRDAIRITVSFTVYEHEDIYGRETALEKANAWARDGWLEISTKLNRRIYVNCVTRASVKKSRDYKEEFSIVFESADSPFWEDKNPTRYNLAGTNVSKNVSIPGTRKSAPAAVAIVPTGGTLNTLTLNFGASSMSFTGLNIPVGHSLVLDYGENGYLRIMSANVSKYACRSGDSDDDLQSDPGVQPVGFTANVACGVDYSVRGRYE